MCVRTLVACTLLGWFGSVLFVAESRAEVIRDAQFGFTMELSSDFTARPDLVGATPDIIHAFQYGDAADNEIAVLLFVEKLGGVIGQERLTLEDMPPEFSGKLFVTEWKGFEVDGFEVPETANGINVITFNAQIPLRGEAIQVKLFGPAESNESLKALLREVLAGLEGETNWIAAIETSTDSDSDNYRTILLGVGIMGILAGLIALWFVSRKTPSGTVLIIAIIIYALSWRIDDVPVREIRLLSGSMRMLGFLAMVWGVIDVLRGRKPKSTTSGEESE